MKKKRICDWQVVYNQGAWGEFFHAVTTFYPGASENKVINLYPERTFQTFEGFAGAITESTGYVYSLLDESQKKEILRSYFDESEINYRFLRVPLDSCDFALGQYEASSKPDLSDFSLARMEKYILPLLDDIQAYCGRKIPLLLSPWSPPSYMKDSKRREKGGKLLSEYYGLYARYLCKYALALKERGYLIEAMTLQNEPNAVQKWDSCVFTAEESKRFLDDFMIPEMKKAGLEEVRIYLWDHNKERMYEWLRDIVDEQNDEFVEGVAFHWYSGDHFEALDLCQNIYPQKKLIVSETSLEAYRYDFNDGLSACKFIAHEMLGDLNHGITRFYDWNLILDEEGGPNYVKNFVLAPYLYDRQEKKLMPHLLSRYYKLISSVVRPGAKRIGMSKFSQNVEATAWLEPDGSIGVVLINPQDVAQDIFLRLEGEESAFVLMPNSIATAFIKNEEN